MGGPHGAGLRERRWRANDDVASCPPRSSIGFSSGREVDGERSRIADRLANDVHLVDVEVVHDDDVAGLEPRREAFSDEPKECAPVVSPRSP